MNPKERRLKPRIVKGSTASFTDHFNLAVFLNNRGTPFCHGSLIHPKFVLTAGHCVKNWDNRNQILLGAFDLTKNTNYERRYTAENIILHQNFDLEELFNDIALIELDKVFIPNREGRINFACLPTFNESCNEYHGYEGYIAGWGKYRNNNFLSSTSNTLRKATVPIVNNTECRKMYNNENFQTSYICAGYLRGKKDSCAGDSGGPLVVKVKNNNNESIFKQIGVASWGYECGEPLRPGVYTCLTSYLSWINSKINPKIAKYKRDYKQQNSII
ncbi:unnamed protein product [Gordionus sp. m RMFG-2023]